MAKSRRPGMALDVAMGQGRNALYLASQGWQTLASISQMKACVRRARPPLHASYASTQSTLTLILGTTASTNGISWHSSAPAATRRGSRSSKEA
jgi:hypothetical protein